MTEPNPKVHRYRSRGQGLAQTILLLWMAVRQHTTDEEAEAIDLEIRRRGLAWALPTMAHTDDDELFTTKEIADRTGYAESTIRSWVVRNHIHQHPTGRYRWGDIYHHIQGERTPN